MPARSVADRDMITLRPYQLTAIEELRKGIRLGKRRQVLISPTGSGKTCCFSSMIANAQGKGLRSLVIAHRRELVDQTLDKLSGFGVKAGVLMGNDSRRDDWLQVQVASIQTLVRRLTSLPPADLIIVDECHRSLSPSYEKVLAAYPNAIIIGATATPFRADKRGLSDVFEASVLAATPEQLIRDGYLVSYEAFAYDSPDLHEVPTVAGDFEKKSLGLACNTGVLVGSVVREYITHALGRRAIVFAVDIKHSETLREEFLKNGISAAHVDCETPKIERKKALQGFAQGDIKVLVSVGIFVEGWDCPQAEVCIIARPTKSLTLWLQMLGRVLRPSPETGKVKALFHDHSGGFLRLGLPDEERDYSLQATSQRTIALLTCPKCFAVGKPRKEGTCQNCGFLLQQPAEPQATKGKRKPKDCVEGTRLSAEEILEIRARGIRADLTPRQIQRAKDATMEEKAAEYKRLLAVAEKKGFKKGFAAHKFRETFSTWPRFPEGFLDTVAAATRPFFELPPRPKQTPPKQPKPPKQEPLPFKKKDKYEAAADLLGVSVTATENDIRRAYREKVKRELEKNGFGDQGDAVDLTIEINSAKSLLIERAKKTAVR